MRAELADAPAAQRKAAGDKRSHDFLMAALAAGRPGDAVLSEEGADDPVRLRSDRVWIVDPLDGTREFSEPAATTGRCTSHCGSAANWSPARSRFPRRASPWPPRRLPPPPAAPGDAAHRGLAHPAARGRAAGA